MAYAFKQIEAHDPNNPGLVAPNASVTIFEPGDPTKTPLTLTTIAGDPLPNPVTVNGMGYGPAFMHATLPQVAWSGGGLTGTFESYEGMRDEAVAARTAAETAAATAGADAAAVADAAIGNATAEAEAAAASAAAAEAAAASSATAAANSAALVGAPADTAIAAAINGTATATKTALNATFAGKWKANTAYASGDTVVAPDGQIVSAKAAFTSGATYDETKWATAAVGQLRGPKGRKYAVVACALRNSGSPNYWQPIEDATHRSTNVTSVTTQTEFIQLDYSALGATRVVSLVAVPDDTLVQAGIDIGTSVGTTVTNLYLTRTKPFSDYIYRDANGWQSKSGKCTFSTPETGSVQINHPEVGSGNVDLVQLTPADGLYLPNINPNSALTPVSRSQIKVQFRDYAGAIVTPSTTVLPKFYFSHGGSGNIQPQPIDIATYVGSNIWVYGILEIA